MIALFLAVLGCVPLWGQDLNSAPAKPDGPAKIQSALWELATPRAAKSSRALQDTVVVILVPQLGQASASIDTSSLAALGGRALAQSKSLMRVAVPASSLLAVSELPGVGFVRRPYRPHSQRTTSEGASRIGALANHSARVRGQGVKVAIIDGGFRGANQLGQDMPARWRYRDYTGEGIYAGEIVHGTACAEIVHDVAPDAGLMLLKTGDLLDFENAKDLCIREGIDIISDSGTWPTTGFGDGRGLACDIVNDAADNGILWVNAAGNEAEGHYSGFWSDSDSDDWHNFRGGDELLTFEAEEGDEIDIALIWNDWPTTSQNYDLYLYHDDERVAESTDIQSRNAPKAPVEWIEIKAERSGRYGIAVRSEGTRPSRLKIWSFEHDFEAYAVAENSIGVPSDARGAMAVGAVHYWNYGSGRVAEYSSRGPTTDGRIKPELVAPSGVATVSYGADGFFGTSAAAPHVAGAAALIKSANPSYSRTQLWNALVAATVDVGTRGRDNTSGYGKLVLPALRNTSSLSRAPQITSVSPSRVRYNQVATIRGRNFGSSRGSSSVRIGSVVVSSFTAWSNTAIKFRVPLNTPPGNLTVRTSEGTSNSVRLGITSPYLTRIAPTQAKTRAPLTLTGGNFGNRRGSGYVLFSSNVRPSAADYVSWSNSRIVVRVPSQARSGNVQVVTSNGKSGTKLLQVASSRAPQITSVSPSRVRYNQVATIRGRNFGSSRGSSSVRIGSVVVSSFTAWSNTAIKFRVPLNTPPGNLTVRTSEGTSNSVRLGITSPYLTRIAPTQAKTRARLTLTGGNFGNRRGTGYVLFSSNVRPSAADYVSWSNSRIVVRVPSQARSGNVQVVTSNGKSGTKLLQVASSRAPQITSVSPSRVRYNQIATIRGRNFGSSRRSSSVRIGSVVVSSFTAWSNTTIKFRVPLNTPPGNLTVRTSEGTSNSVRLGITSPYLTRIAPTQAKPGTRLTLAGGNFGTRRGSGYVLFSSNVRPAATDYVSWSNSRIVVKVPSRARSGNVQVVTSNGRSGTKLLLTASSRIPRIASIAPSQVRYNQVVTLRGSNFGSSRGSSSVRIGSVVVSSFTAWSNTTIKFRVLTNMRSGNLVVRTSEGVSNAVRLEITSPYLGQVSPIRVEPGERLTLAGDNFRSSRGNGYVLFAPNVRPAANYYVTWSDRRIVVRVPSQARSGNVQVVTSNGRSGTKRLEIEQLKPLPSRGLFGYSPPAVSKNPKSVKFGFQGIGEDIALGWSLKNDAEVDILVNGQRVWRIPVSDDWKIWGGIVKQTYLNSGQNVLEFRNRANQNRTSSFTHWQLKDVKWWKPANAKPVAGANWSVVESGLGAPFPTPFNAEVIIPFALAEAGPVRLAVYNLMGQSIRVLADGWVAAGAHQVRWDGRTDAGAAVASGVYWAVLQTGEAVQTAKVALIR